MIQTIVNSRDSLIELINKDAAVDQRFAVRFIEVSFTDWQWLVLALADRTHETLRISTECIDSDTLPMTQGLIAKLFQCRNSITLLGVSELIRLYPTERTRELISFLVQMENGSEQIRRRRVYVPLLGAMEALTSRSTAISRSHHHYESAAAFVLVPPQNNEPLELQIQPKDIQYPLSDSCCDGIQTWLKIVESGWLPQKCVIRTNTIPFITATSSSIVQVKVVANTYDLLQTMFMDLPDESLGNDEQWRYLLSVKTRVDCRSFDDLLLSTLPHPATDNRAILAQWNQMNAIQRWAAWLLFKRRLQNDMINEGYFSNVIRSCIDSESLVDCVICTIFSYHPRELGAQSPLHTERNHLLNCLEITELPEAFWAELSTFSPIQQFQYLSYTTEKEKCHAVLLIRDLGFSLHDVHSRDDICIRYPALYAYTAETSFLDPWLTEYFDNLRLAKLRNEYPQSIRDAILQWPEKCFAYRPRNDALIQELTDDNTIVQYWDSLGAEWIPMLYTVITRLSPNTNIRVEAVRANLPSITSFNKPDGFNYHCFEDKRLDKLQHINIDYPLYFVQQLELVQEIAQIAGKSIEQHSVLVLTADHGSSRLAVLNHRETERLPQGSTAKYLGRFAISTDPVQGSGWLVEEQHLVRTNHVRFIAAGLHGCENHGGATPEEMLVPLLILQQAKVRILRCPTEIHLRGRRSNVWSIIVDRPVTKAYVTINNEDRTAFISNDGTELEFELLGIRPGKYSIRIQFILPDGQHFEQPVALRVSAGIEINSDMEL